MIAEKKYFMAKSIVEAIQMAKTCDDNFRFLAGGTDILVNKFQGNDSSSGFIDITSIAELHKIEVTKEHLKIGSLVTLDELCEHSELKKIVPSLVEAANAVGSPIIRKTGTIGGNLLCENRCSFYNQSEWWREAIGNCLKCDGDICIATGGKKNCFSKFVSDTAIALISLDAQIEVISPEGTKLLKIEEIYTGNGVTPRVLSNKDLITYILIPHSKKIRSIFLKMRQRESLEFSSLSTAVTVNENGKLRIVLGGVDPKPVLIVGMETDDQSELINSAVKKARIVENDVYPRIYRKEMIRVFLTRCFKELSLQNK